MRVHRNENLILYNIEIILIIIIGACTISISLRIISLICTIFHIKLKFIKNKKE